VKNANPSYLVWQDHIKRWKFLRQLKLLQILL
jgi:hypothetical protein